MRKATIGTAILGVVLTVLPTAPVLASPVTPDVHGWHRSTAAITDLVWTHDRDATAPVTSDLLWKGGQAPVTNAVHPSGT